MLTHWGQDEMAAIFQCIFMNENVWILIKISPKFVPRGQINNIPALVQIMAWRRSGDKPLSEQMMVDLLMHIWVTQPQWVKTIKGFLTYINCPTRTNKSKSLITLDNKKSPGKPDFQSCNLKFTIVFTRIWLDMQPLKLQRAMIIWWQGCPSSHKI